MWFEKLTGFTEESHNQVQHNISINDGIMTSLANDKSYSCGRLEIPTLAELRERSALLYYNDNQLKLTELVANVQDLYNDSANVGAMFQVASQFNLLEMVGPRRTPEDGVDMYEDDATQGPASAIACGAATIYRNYFVNVNGSIGQTSDNQVDCLQDIGNELNNDNLQLWQMRNGYALADMYGLERINNILKGYTASQYDNLKSKIRIGVQWNAEVTLNHRKDKVNQAFCSALPVAYSNVGSKLWERFARLVLEATYEATFRTALINYERPNGNLKGNNKLFLTLVGGGAFGNETEWVIDAISKSLKLFRNTPLDVRIVSYGSSRREVRELIENFH